MPSILIVEDNRDNREALAHVVAILGYRVVTAESGEEALDMVGQCEDLALVLCDIRLPGMDGIAFKAAALARRPALRLVFMTGDASAADDAVANGAIAMLKPYDFTILTRVIAEALEAKPER